MTVASRRLYLDASGNVVEHGDSAGVTLLVAVGQEIPAGYVEPDLEAKAEKSPPNKAASKPADKAAR